MRSCLFQSHTQDEGFSWQKMVWSPKNAAKCDATSRKGSGGLMAWFLTDPDEVQKVKFPSKLGFNPANVDCERIKAEDGRYPKSSRSSMRFVRGQTRTTSLIPAVLGGRRIVAAIRGRWPCPLLPFRRLQGVIGGLLGVAGGGDHEFRVVFEAGERGPWRCRVRRRVGQ